MRTWGVQVRRRPLLFVAAGFVAALLIGYYLGIAAAVCMGAAMLIAVILMQKQEHTNKRRAVVLLVMISYCSGVMVFHIHDDSLEKQEESLMGQTDSIEGTIRETEKKHTEEGESYVQMIVESDNGKVLVKYYADDFTGIPGDNITAKGEMSVPAVKRNPGCFDYRLYLKSAGITVIMTAKSLTVTNKNTFSGSMYLIKENFIMSLRRATDRDTAALMRAIMFGDKGELDEDMLEVFQRNGTAHILAVSGLHIGIIYAFILKLWIAIGKLTGNAVCGRRGALFFVFNIAFFICYMIMADFSPSVVRAVMMVFLHIFAQLTGRRYDLSSASLAVLILVLADNPFMLFNVGLQMSFLAVLTLVLTMPFVRHFYSGIFLSGLVVQIGLGPFLLYSFNYLSLIAVFINVPVIFLAGLIVPTGLTTMALGGLPVFGIGAKATQFLCSMLEWLNSTAEVRNVTTFQVAGPPLTLMAFYYLALLTLATEEGRLAVIRAANAGATSMERLKAGIKYVAKVCSLILVLSVAFAYVAGDHFDKCNLTFVDVGQGDCMCIRADKGLIAGESVYLIDGGGNSNFNLGKKTLKSYLLKNGMSHVDAAFVTHLHMDHYRGICELCKEGMVRKIYVYEGNRLKEQEIIEETGLSPGDIGYIRSGQSVILGEGGLLNRHCESVEVLWPCRKTDSEYAGMLNDEEDENSMSMILKVHFRNESVIGDESETELLVTGDLGEEGEKELISAAGTSLGSAVLKVGHHGSKYSSSDLFIDSVSPDIAVIQVGKNNYGHPAPEVLERLDSRGIQVFRNDLQGAVGFEIRNGKVRKIRKIID